MIQYKTGDMFAEDVEALVNPVNCVGVMGKGLALRFKTRFPRNFAAYRMQCEDGLLRPGHIHLTREGERYIINFPTKVHWKDPSRIEYIEWGLKELIRTIGPKCLDIRSIAIPALGCGLGGLNWDAVRPKIEAAMAALPNVMAIVFEPQECKK